MIKVGITGAGSPIAGELIRLLIFHPDVELVQLCQPELAGRDMSDIHHGLLGEKKLSFSKTLDMEDVDIIFHIASAAPVDLEETERFVNSKEDEDEQSGFVIFLDSDDKFIGLSSPYYLKCESKIEEDEEEDKKSSFADMIVYGLPEINRKPLVRGAKKAVIPSAVETAALVLLYPFAGEIDIPENLSINIKGAKELIESYRKSQINIENRLSEVLSNLTEKRINVTLCLETDETTDRSIQVSVDVKANVTIDELRRLVEEEYDDHNMSHLSLKSISYHEVEGTDNCLIEINHLDGNSYRLTALADGRLRGGAGEAIHVMNLLAGLYEKTGLHLKASRF